MRILLFTGKGGVGKTTVAAATATRAAEHGLRTIVCSTDPAHSLADAFDAPLGDRPTPIAHLLSGQQLNARVRLRAEADEMTQVPSIIDVFPGADWFERECYDLYGVIFTGHPDMRRLLTDYGFDGHPLRKDFPLTGFLEVRYDDQEKRVVYEPVRLNQEFRKFDFLSPWEGADYPVLPGDEKAGPKV